MHRLRYRYRDVLHDGHDVWFGNPNRHWDRVRFRDRNGLGNMDDVWFGYLLKMMSVRKTPYTIGKKDKNRESVSR